MKYSINFKAKIFILMLLMFLEYCKEIIKEFSYKIFLQKIKITLHKLIGDHIANNSTIYSDGWSAYVNNRITDEEINQG
jgi:hypothetical protein